jgi:hypothetical protein
MSFFKISNGNGNGRRLLTYDGAKASVGKDDSRRVKVAHVGGGQKQANETGIRLAEDHRRSQTATNTPVGAASSVRQGEADTNDSEFEEY